MVGIKQWLLQQTTRRVRCAGRRRQGTLPLPCACTALCLKPQGKLIFANMMHIEGVS